LLEWAGTEEVEIYRYVMAAAQGHGCAEVWTSLRCQWLQERGENQTASARKQHLGQIVVAQLQSTIASICVGGSLPLRPSS
jgi:hypothetical protein